MLPIPLKRSVRIIVVAMEFAMVVGFVLYACSIVVFFQVPNSYEFIKNYFGINFVYPLDNLYFKT